jgi:hypothetical protein
MHRIIRPLQVLFLSVTAAAAADWDGKFVWSNTGGESNYGNVKENVTMTLSTANGVVNVALGLSWQPGAAVDIEQTVNAADVVTKPDSSGNPTWAFSFSFEDSFENKGTARVNVTSQGASLSLHSTEVHDSRGSRQYGDYNLTRSTSP